MKKIYLSTERKPVELSKALTLITNEWIEAGNDSWKTLMDVRDACKVLLKENNKLKEEIEEFRRKFMFQI